MEVQAFNSRQEELLQKILDEQKKQVKYERLKFIFACCGLLMGLIALTSILIGFSFLKTHITALADEVAVTTAGINDVSDKLKEIDFKAIEETYQSFVSTAEDTIEQLKNDTEGINELIDQTMDTMKEADSVFESISKVDFSSLSEGIKKFNEVIEPLSRLFGSFGR